MVEFINKLICFNISIGTYYIEKKEKVAEQLSAFKITMELYTMFFYHCIFIPFGPIILSFCMNWLWLHIPGIIDDIIARHTVHAESKTISTIARAMQMYSMHDKLTKDNIVHFAQLAHFDKYSVSNYYNFLRTASQNEMLNLLKLLNPEQVDMSMFKRMHDVHSYCRGSLITQNMNITNIVSTDIYTRASLACEFLNGKFIGISETKSAIKDGLVKRGGHPYFSITVDNGTNIYRQFCLLTHTPPPECNKYATVLGVDNHVPLKNGVRPVSHALCIWLVLEDEAFLKENSNIGSRAYKCAVEYQKELLEHTGMSMNNVITMEKYLMIYRLIKIVEMNSEIFLDFNKLKEENPQLFENMDDKTKYEMDELEEINFKKFKK